MALGPNDTVTLASALKDLVLKRCRPSASLLAKGVQQMVITIMYRKTNPAGRLARRPAVLFGRLARRQIVKKIAFRFLFRYFFLCNIVLSCADDSFFHHEFTPLVGKRSLDNRSLK